MDRFGFDPPDLEHDEVAAIASERYGLTGDMQRLRGERSHNTLFTERDGSRFVLKVASASESFDGIDFRAQALVHLERRAPHLPVARMVPSVDGELVPIAERSGKQHAMRLVTFLPGVTFDDDAVVSGAGLRSIGRLVGALSEALADFAHAVDGSFMPWDLANGLILDADLWTDLRPDARTLLAPVRDRLVAALVTMQELPRQVIHNDAHAGNLLRASVSSERVTGLIDFGDLVRTVTAADLGVTGANLVPQQADPIASLGALVAGFQEHRPLSPAEREAVPDLILCRLALSTLMTDHQIAGAPHIADAVLAERPRLLANLARWCSIDRSEAQDVLEAVSA
jgi:Ser/Thr protein kinase RdoA (MazF antagonist)